MGQVFGRQDDDLAPGPARDLAEGRDGAVHRAGRGSAEDTDTRRGEELGPWLQSVALGVWGIGGLGCGEAADEATEVIALSVTPSPWGKTDRKPGLCLAVLHRAC